MPLTGRLGTINSLPSNILLGADVTATLTQSISDPISFVQDVVSSTKEFALSHTITFLSLESHVREVHQAVSSTLVFAQVFNASQGKFATDTITFSQSVTEGIARHYSLSNALALTQLTYENIKNLSASNALALVQTESHTGPVYQTIHHTLSLSSDPGETKGTNHQQASSTLFLKDTAGRVLTASASSTLSFAQTGRRFTGAAQTIAFVQQVRVGKGDDVFHTLFFVDTAGHKSVFRRSLSSTLALLQSVTYTVDGNCNSKRYTPYVGTGDPGYTSPSTTQPTLGDGTFTLTYPYTSPTSTLVLRNPNYGNRDQLSFGRVNRTTRGGTLIVFADTSWPKIQKLLVTIAVLKQSQVDDLRTFLATSLGKEIGLLDHENRQWRGLVTNPDMEITENSRNNRAVSFEFEGSLA